MYSSSDAALPLQSRSEGPLGPTVGYINASVESGRASARIFGGSNPVLSVSMASAPAASLSNNATIRLAMPEAANARTVRTSAEADPSTVYDVKSGNLM